MKIGISLLAFMAFGAPVVAQQCSDIDNLAVQNICYNINTTAGQRAYVEDYYKKWQVEVEDVKNAADTPDVAMAVRSDTYVFCGPRGSTLPTLQLRCKDNTTSMYVLISCDVTDSQNFGQITYQLDDLPEITKSFLESTDNRALGLWDGASSIPFIKSMFNHDTLQLRFRTSSGLEVSPQFSISGLVEQIAPLRDSCNW